MWVSADKPGNAELVGTYTFFGHWSYRQYRYLICSETFPDDPTTSTVDERVEWARLIKDAFGQWQEATDGFVEMIPSRGPHDSCATGSKLSDFIALDDHQNEVRVIDVDDPDNNAWSFLEMKSDVFKSCLFSGDACVTSFAGYTGLQSDNKKGMAILTQRIGQDSRSLFRKHRRKPPVLLRGASWRQ